MKMDDRGVARDECSYENRSKERMMEYLHYYEEAQKERL